jgi:protein-tyrosine phosphatase
LTQNDSRFIKLEGAYNFRDVGGIKIDNGSRIKPGIIYRSDELSELTRNDLITLERLNLKLVCDLRTPGEKKSKPDHLPNNKIRTVSIPVHPHQEDYSQRKFFLSLNYNSHKLDFEKLIKEYYYCFAFERTEQIKEIITLLSDKNNLPALVHCSIGKDRTGFVSALVQLVAGASRQQVLDDYFDTNNYIGGRIKKVIRFLRIMSLFRIPAERFRPLLEVHKEYLDNVLEEIFKTNGTIEKYLSGVCHVDQSHIQNLKHILIDTD